MSDEIEMLTARAKQLEEANAMLRSMQSPSGGARALEAENAMLRNELSLVRDAPRAVGLHPTEAGLPETVEQFNAMGPHERQTAAYRMTRQQRDSLLGRSATRDDRDTYL